MDLDPGEHFPEIRTRFKTFCKFQSMIVWDAPDESACRAHTHTDRRRHELRRPAKPSINNSPVCSATLKEQIRFWWHVSAEAAQRMWAHWNEAGLFDELAILNNAQTSTFECTELSLSKLCGAEKCFVILHKVRNPNQMWAHKDDEEVPSEPPPRTSPPYSPNICPAGTDKYVVLFTSN